MTTHAEPLRFHALDSLRASAMLLGIFLHMAWFFAPVAMGAPVIDRSANDWLWYGFQTIHVFRMQAFFLIAGFFAHLVLDRRGTSAFIRQRLVRIGLPFAVGWLIWWPLSTWCYLWAGIRSGSIISDTNPLWIMVAALFSPELMRVLLNLTHLWFLYALLWYYAAALILRWLVTLVLDRSGYLRRRFATAFGALMRSRWNVLLLAIPTALWIWPMDWAGVDPPSSLVPPLLGFLTYGLFFAVGWFLDGQLELLQEFDRRWQWHLALGLLITVPLFLVYSSQRRAGTLTNPEVYPSLSPDELRDWSAFRAKLLQEKDGQSVTIGKKIWDELDGPTKEFVSRVPELDPNQKSGIVMQLDILVLGVPALVDGVPVSGLKLTRAAKGILAKKSSKRTSVETRLLNRLVLEASFPGAFAPGTLGDPKWKWYKLAYSAAYAVAAWLLVFGFLGLFRRYCNHPSNTWRYLADASYWFYLVHLPILFFIQIPLAPVPLAWPIKVLIITGLTFAILLLSYHFLVRSTFIGVILNGRKYPFRVSFLTRSTQRSAEEVPSPR